MRRAALLVVVGMAGIAVWTACTGDNPATTATGAVGQPCNDGDVCNTADLQCTGGYCQLKAAGTSSGATGTSGSGSTTSSSSGSSGSSGSTSSSSSGAAVTCTDFGKYIDAGADKTLHCPTDAGIAACNGTEVCCPGVGCRDSCGDAPAWTCFNSDNCTGDNGCYVLGAEWFKDLGVCGAPYGGDAGAQKNGSKCIFGSSGTYIQLCTHDDQCDEHMCRKTSIMANGVNIVVGACVNDQP